MTTAELQLLTLALQRTGLSARALAALCGVDERTMRRWQAGDTAIPGSARQLLRIVVEEPQLVMDILGAHPRPPGWMARLAFRD